MLVSTLSFSHRLSILALTAIPMVFGLTIQAQPLCAQSLQERIDQASPGDTVLVAPGDYSRPVTMHKDITLKAEGGGTSRLAGLTGSLGSVVGIVFDGTLQAVPGDLATAGSGLFLENCAFTGPIRGIRVIDGADNVHIRGCSFNAVIEGVFLEKGVLSVRVENSMFSNITVGIAGPDSLECQPDGNRQAANRCPGGACGQVEIVNVTMDGGDRQVILAGDYVLSITSSIFRNATTNSIHAAGVRLEIIDSEIVGNGGVGTGLELASVSGFVHGTRIQSWDRGIVVGDGGCSRFSDVVCGEEISNSCDISNHTWNLTLEQPEKVDANLNFWGTTNCESVQAQISGQKVSSITNAEHSAVIPCLDTPVEPITWGRLKARYGETGRP